MKNVTVTLSEDLVRVLDSVCKDCDCSRYAFAKEAILEKIERHTGSSQKGTLEEADRGSGKPSERDPRRDESLPPWLVALS